MPGLSRSTWDLRFFVVVAPWKLFSCGRWDLVPQLGIGPRPPALSVWSLSYWTTREVPSLHFLDPPDMIQLPPERDTSHQHGGPNQH